MNKKLNALPRFNLIMGILHLIQGIGMVLLATVIFPELGDFRPTIVQFYQTLNPQTMTLFTTSRELFELPYALMAASFLLLSALFHFIIVGNKTKYLGMIKKGYNSFRWIEYSISSSVIIVLTAMLFGVLDLATLFLILVANATMNLLGLEMELSNQKKDEKKNKVNWGPFIWGSVIGFAPWVVILIYLLGSSNLDLVPNFVWAIVASYFILFNAFPINMYLQYKKIGPWKDYIFGERGYIVLSLVAKTILAWLVFFGALQTTNILERIFG